MKKYDEKRFSWNLLLPQKENILRSNQQMRSDKTPLMIYVDLASLIKEIGNCKNNPENSSTTKIKERISCGYSVSIIWAFDNI